MIIVLFIIAAVGGVISLVCFSLAKSEDTTPITTYNTSPSLLEEDDENEDLLDDDELDEPFEEDNGLYETIGGIKVIKKSVSAITSHVYGVSDGAATALPSIIESMRNDEVIMYAFKSMMLERNPGRSDRDSITSALHILTNKGYYFAGDDGQSSVLALRKKSGFISWRDVHAITLGEMRFQGAYVSFEVNHDNYKVWLGGGANGIKYKGYFDDAIRTSQDEDRRGTTIQATLSPADELKKYKELLDEGIITQEEFDAKKKQLLDL